MKATILIATLVLLAGAFTGTLTAADPPGHQIDYWQLLARYDGDYHPIVGIDGNRLILELKDGSHGRIRGNVDKWRAAVAPVAGNITIFEAEKEVRPLAFGDPGYYGGRSEGLARFDLLADRDLTDVYVAFLYFEGSKDSAPYSIYVEPIGDIPAGVRVERAVARISEGQRQGYTSWHFFTGGQPLGVIDFDTVALDPRTNSLAIPFEYRLEHYLAQSRGADARPKIFNCTVPSVTPSLCQEQDLSRVMVKARIRVDGAVDILEIENACPTAVQPLILSDAETWRFFPLLRDGKPQPVTIQLPLNFEQLRKSGGTL